MQKYIDKYFFAFFLFIYVFGLLFYNTIALATHFEGTDELCLLALVMGYVYVVFADKDWRINRVFLFTLGVFLFYLIYSFSIHSNRPAGILMDFLIQMKPYLAFFCVYQLKPRLDDKQKLLLNQACLLVWFAWLLPIGVLGAINDKFFFAIVAHPTNFAASVAVTSLLYLFSSPFRLRDRLIFIGLLALGLLSGRSKFFGFFVLASAFALYFTNPRRIRFSFLNVILGLVALALVLLVAKTKIEFYFMQGLTGDAEPDYIARFALYANALPILEDYFPFGSGLASYATYTSGVYYSPIYTKYGISSVWGLSKNYHSFISDTYYPSLAQFGWVGVFLYLSFWVYIVHKALSLGAARSPKYFVMALSIICFFLIESVADSTFTGNRGLVMMMLLGYLMSNLSYEEVEPKPALAADEVD
jgi:hypothetical protein